MDMESVVFYFLLLFVVPALNASRFRCDYMYYPQVRGWFKLHNTPASWDYAKQICKYEGAELVAPTSDFIKLATQSLMTVNDTAVAVHIDVHESYSNRRMRSKGPKYIYDNSIPNYANEEETQVVEMLVLTKDGVFERAVEFWYPFVCHKKEEEIEELNKNCGTFDSEYLFDIRTNLCYKFHRARRGWYEALFACAAEGGNLAIINYNLEASVIRDIFALNPPDSIPGDIWLDSAFLGIRTLDGEKWTTIYGETLEDAGYDKWFPGEPNNARGDEFCGTVGRNGLLFDDPCSRELPFICEKEPTTIPMCEDKERALVVTPPRRMVVTIKLGKDNNF